MSIPLTGGAMSISATRIRGLAETEQMGNENDYDINVIQQNQYLAMLPKNGTGKKVGTLTLNNNEGEVEDIAFIFENTKSVNIVLHIKDNNEYYLNENEVEVKNDNYGKYDIVNVTITENKGISRYTFHTLREEPLFQIIKPNIVNNQDVTSPLGISIYFNAISDLRS